jgi:hypothetical protein
MTDPLYMDNIYVLSSPKKTATSIKIMLEEFRHMQIKAHNAFRGCKNNTPKLEIDKMSANIFNAMTAAVTLKYIRVEPKHTFGVVITFGFTDSKAILKLSNNRHPNNINDIVSTRPKLS